MRPDFSDRIVSNCYSGKCTITFPLVCPSATRFKALLIWERSNSRESILGTMWFAATIWVIFSSCTASARTKRNRYALPCRIGSQVCASRRNADAQVKGNALIHTIVQHTCGGNSAQSAAHIYNADFHVTGTARFLFSQNRLWYGNIEPSEYDASSAKVYKEALRRISRNEESLQDTLTDAQRQLFAQYMDGVRELQDMAECLLFQNSFRLGARMMLEIMHE